MCPRPADYLLPGTQEELVWLLDIQVFSQERLCEVRGQVEPKPLPILPSLAFLLSDCPSLPSKAVDTA